MTPTADHSHPKDFRYDPPAVIEIGTVADLTLSGCFMDKKWGSSDGVKFLDIISIPISSC